jgi:hypothetical protein
MVDVEVRDCGHRSRLLDRVPSLQHVMDARQQPAAIVYDLIYQNKELS